MRNDCYQQGLGPQCARFKVGCSGIPSQDSIWICSSTRAKWALSSDEGWVPQASTSHN